MVLSVDPDELITLLHADEPTPTAQDSERLRDLYNLLASAKLEDVQALCQGPYDPRLLHASCSADNDEFLRLFIEKARLTQNSRN